MLFSGEFSFEDFQRSNINQFFILIVLGVKVWRRVIEEVNVDFNRIDCVNNGRQW